MVGGKLIFKGDKEHKKKKKKRSASERDEHGGVMGDSDEGWVRADQLDDLVGPLFITHPSDPTICLTVDDNDRLLAYPIPEGATETEPVIVNQVFVGARLLGTSNTFTIKSVHKKYLSSDKFGVVSADREAISGLEEWEPAMTDAGVAFRNAHGKFLMVDQIAGGGFKIRADSDEIGFCETFRVYCQARFKRKARHERKKAKKESNIDELDNVKKFQSWGGGRVHMSKSDTRELKKAKEEGRIAEAMLDRRAKVKSDRYCK
ncbi:hypothetical protein K492DRAFT_203056 [Lichtheimia hyalospora FSU 10163]|nr:hypothetical protein K492DRAFT_203056 [Lichtheimia hyalospora FSU 10163]